jgi:hypothetical protein
MFPFSLVDARALTNAHPEHLFGEHEWGPFMRIVMGLLCLLIASGCAATSTVQVGREIALPNQPLDPMPTITVVLTESARTENFAFCDVFVKMQTWGTASTRVESSQNVIPVRWLAKQEVKDDGDCGEMLARYDYDRAARLLVEVKKKLPGAELEGAGPYLVEHISTSTGQAYAVIKMSGETKFTELEEGLKDLLGKQVNLISPTPNVRVPNEIQQVCSTAQDDFARAVLTIAQAIPWGVGTAVVLADTALQSSCNLMSSA